MLPKGVVECMGRFGQQVIQADGLDEVGSQSGAIKRPEVAVGDGADDKQGEGFKLGVVEERGCGVIGEVLLDEHNAVTGFA